MKKHDDLGPSSELLRTFCAVAEAGNVTSAAAALCRTQSAVSVQIRNLETRLSARLFERHARGVTLTAAGKALLPAAEKALAEIDRVGALFSKPLTGRVRVGIPDDYNETLLRRALRQFSLAHGEVDVFVRSGCTTGFPEAVRRGDLDLAVYSARPCAPGDCFFSEPNVWAAGADFVLDESAPVPLAVFDRDCWWREVAPAALKKAQRNWRTAYLSENFSSVKTAISSGIAVGVLATSAVEPSMRILAADEGFPPLPPSSLMLLKNDHTSASVVGEMEKAIRDAA